MTRPYRTIWHRFGTSARATLAAGVLGVLAAGALACSPEGTEEGKFPPKVRDPEVFRTPAGAMALYRSAVSLVPEELEWFVFRTGVLTDELVALPLPALLSGNYTLLDSRQVVEAESDYLALHRLRGQAQEARGFLAAYVTDTTDIAEARILRGHLFALEGYADTFLADFFCSGIPLSTVDFGGDFTLVPGSRTNEVYAHAAQLLDSAVALTSGNDTLHALAAVGLGRVLLALGQYAAAAAAVALVPDAFVHQVTTIGTTAGPFTLAASEYNVNPGGASQTTGNGTPSVSDREGGNGLSYRSSRDPRVVVDSLGLDLGGNPMFFPAKYPREGPVTLILASGIEARLIEAEAALQGQVGGADWLTRLNALRTDGTFEEQPTPDPDDDPGAMDTLWHAGTGGVPGLKPLTDPGTVNARLDLLFAERGFWLYLTGHRQGDLRRLVRVYLRPQDLVYPAGAYQGGNTGGQYGIEVVAPVPESERELNPQYSGCANLEA